MKHRSIGWQAVASGLLSASLLVLGGNTAKAGNYFLTYGKQFEVCRAFAENLASFDDLPQGLFEWPINPKLKKFRKPAWTPLDPKQHLGLIENWVRATLSGGDPPDSAKGDLHWKGRLAEILAGQSRLERVVVDVNNDGIQEVLYRTQFPYMVYYNKFNTNIGWEYFAVDVNNAAFDPSFRNIPYWTYDSFFYDGRFFLAHGPWPYSPGPLSTDLTIVEIAQPRPTGGFAYIPVCRFGYAPRRIP